MWFPDCVFGWVNDTLTLEPYPSAAKPQIRSPNLNIPKNDG